MNRLRLGRSITIAILALVLGSSTAQAQTDVGGVIASDTTWSAAGSPYRLTNHVQVAAGTTLTIDPGVVVEAAGNWFLQIDGTLRALGTVAQPITFGKTATNSGFWQGLRFTSSSMPYDATTGAGSIVQFATLRDAYPTVISSTDASPLLTDLDIVNFPNVAIIGTPAATQPLWVRNSRLHDGASPLRLSGNFIAEGNEFFHNSDCVNLTGGDFRHNFLHDNSYFAVCPGANTIVQYNTIVRNGGAGIVLLTANSGNQQIHHNTIGGHQVDLFIAGPPTATIYQNNFIGAPVGGTLNFCVTMPGGYHVVILNSCGGPSFPPGGATIDLTNNYWNTTDPAQIAATIYDSQDDLTLLGTSNVTPFLTAPGPNAGGLQYPALSVAHVEPSLGLTTGGGTVRVFGHNFAPGITLTIGGTAATDVVRLSATLLMATVPPGVVGLRDITVINPDATTGTRVNGFRYLDSAADDDGDGLTNGQEVTQHGTNPLAVDSDQDGVSDAVEVGAGTNPLDPRSIPGATIVGGVMSGDTTWSLAGSPYRLTNHLRVAAGTTLTIDPGVVVEAAGNWFLQIDGTLRALGTVAQPITFGKTATNSGFWQGLRFTSSSMPYDATTGAGSIVQFATLRDAYPTVISSTDASPLLTDLDIVNFPNVAIIGTPAATQPLWVRNSRLHDGASPLRLSGNFIAEGNEFFHNSDCVNLTGGDFRHNFLHDNSYFAVCPGANTIVQYNTIVRNGGAGIVLLTANSGNQQIHHNTIGGHQVDLFIAGPPTAAIYQNNFIGAPVGGTLNFCVTMPGGYHVVILNSCGGPSFPPGGATIDLTNNYWNTTDPAQIAATIYDSQDDLTLLGTSNVTPFLTAPGPNAGGLQYPALSVAHVEPSLGLTTGGGTVRVFGHNFAPGITLTIGGTAATDVVRLSATLLMATVPPGVVGLRDITVINPDATTGTRVNGFRYLDSAADDDGDGLTNGQEVTQHGTNPLAVDSDQDGVSDAVEVGAGTNPLDPRSIPGATIVGGVMSGDTTWSLAGSPYRLTNHLRVAAGTTLTIDPGVVVEAAGNWFLQIDGTLRALGTVAQPITFGKTATNSGFWQGLRFTSSSMPYDATTGAGSIVQFATLRDAYPTVISSTDASPLLTDLDIVNFPNVAIIGTPAATQPLWVRNSRLHDGASPLRLSGNFIAEGNEFFHNSDCVNLTGGDFRHNFLHDNSYFAVCPGANTIVQYNTIVRNGGAGIVLLTANSGNQQIHHNTIGGHQVDLFIAGPPTAAIYQNNFIGAPVGGTLNFCVTMPGGYHVVILNSCGGPSFPPGGATIDLTNNYWNTTDPAQIAATIYDSQDDLTLLGTSNVTPFLTAPTDNLPVSSAGPDQVVSAATTVQLNGLASSDVDGDTLSFSWYQLSGPKVTLLGADTATPTFVPLASGTFSFALTVHDGRGGFSFDTVQITSNNAPVANDDSRTTPEDTPIAGVLPATNPGGGPLTFSIVANGTLGTAAITNATTGEYSYTPVANANGTDSFTFKVNDGTSDSNIATVTVLITPVNDAPVAVNGALSTNEDTSGSGTLSATDIDSPTLTFSIVSNGAKGTAVITNPATGAYTYTPNLNANGSDSFAFKATDGSADSNVATVSITINPVNDAAVAVSDAVTTAEDTDKPITLAASDVDGDTLTFSIVTGPTHGTLSGSAPTVTYTPALNYFGPDSFTFKANDGASDSNVATVAITVSPVNDAPVASDGTLATTQNLAATGTLVATDVDGPSLTFAIAANGAKGVATVTNATTGAYSYTPNAGVTGTDAFTFTASDGSLTSNLATITVTIAPKQTPSITWANPANITFPTPLSGTQLNATANVAGTFAYAPTTGTVLNAGNGQTLSVIFTPADTAHYTTAAKSVLVNVAPASSTTTLLATPGTVGFLQTVYLVAAIAPVAPATGAPGGIVEFFDGGSSLGTAAISGGVAYVSANGLAPGGHPITARYHGAGNFAASISAPAAVTVQPPSTSTFTYLVAATNPQAVGQPAVFAAAVLPLAAGPTPTGLVQFLDNNVVIGTAAVAANGVAVFSPTTLTAGIHLIGARYLGNGTLSPSTAPAVLQTIYAGARPASTSIMLVSAPNPAPVGTPVAFTATVTGASSGIAAFFADGLFVGAAPVISIGGVNTAVFATPTLPVGAHIVTASFIGGADVAVSNSTPMVQVVQ